MGEAGFGKHDPNRDRGPEWDDQEDNKVTASGEAATVNPVEADAKNADKFAELKDKGREAFDQGWHALQQRMQKVKDSFRRLPGAAKDLGREAMAQAYTVPARLESSWQAGQERLGQLRTGAEARIQSSRESFNHTREAISGAVSGRLNKIREGFAEYQKNMETQHAAELARRRQERVDKLLQSVSELRAERDRKNNEIMQKAYERVKANRAEYRGPIQERQQEIAQLQAETSGNATVLGQMSENYASNYLAWAHG